MRKVSLLAASLVLSLSTAALAQTATQSPGTNTPTGSSNQAVNPSNSTGPDAARTGSVTSPTLEEGSNSFTEGQARSRMEAAGFSDLKDLKKEESGIWKATASKDGQQVTVGLDYKGNVAPVR